jgi:hypothetical protein
MIFDRTAETLRRFLKMAAWQAFQAVSEVGGAQLLGLPDFKFVVIDDGH